MVLSAGAIGDGWVEGSTHATQAGANRMLIGIMCVEGSGSNDQRPTAIDFGGQAMVQETVAVIVRGNGLTARVECWRLMEAGIAAATDGDFTFTWTPIAPAATQFHFFSAYFDEVNQASPVTDEQTDAVEGSHTSMSTASLSTVASGYAIQALATNNDNVNFTHQDGFVEQILDQTGALAGVAAGRSTDGAARSPQADYSQASGGSAILAVSFAPFVGGGGGGGASAFATYIPRRRRVCR